MNTKIATLKSLINEQTGINKQTGIFNIRCIFHFRKSTLCYISPDRDLQMPLAFNVYILIYFLLIWKVLQDINLDFGKCYRV